MNLIETAQAEIRKIFDNEIECLHESAAKITGTARFVIFERTIRLAGANGAAGKTCTSHIVYAIDRTDGYWEQVASHNEAWI